MRPGKAHSILLVAMLLGGGTVSCSAQRPPAHPTFTMQTGDQLVVAFVTASWGRGLDQPELREALDSLWAVLPREAERQRLSIMFLGAALDRDPNAGYRALQGMQFDQVVTGGWWLNMVSVQYLFRDFPGQPSVPQLILFRRRIELGESSIRIGADSVIGRFVGTGEIAEFARRERHL